MRKCTVEIMVRFSESDILNEQDERVLELTDTERYKEMVIESVSKEIVAMGNNVEIKKIEVGMKIEDI